ncbi:MAG: hypothetical protein JJ992_03100 [Planctomycetes bacterium]|nr:hypothetical protein [Planctomycetota bacterium]
MAETNDGAPCPIRKKLDNCGMDQLKIDVAMLVVVGIIVWVGGAYALDGWRSHRLRSAVKQRQTPHAQDMTSTRDDQQAPPAEAA